MENKVKGTKDGRNDSRDYRYCGNNCQYYCYIDQYRAVLTET